MNATHCIECGGASDASHNCGSQDEAHSYLEFEMTNYCDGLGLCLKRLAGTDADTIAALRKALATADDAITEMFRYYDGGETRGSYDGKPERNQLRKAGYAVRAALSIPTPSPLASIHPDTQSQPHAREAARRATEGE